MNKLVATAAIFAVLASVALAAIPVFSERQDAAEGDA
jgi:hypothetical protein